MEEIFPERSEGYISMQISDDRGRGSYIYVIYLRTMVHMIYSMVDGQLGAKYTCERS